MTKKINFHSQKIKNFIAPWFRILLVAILFMPSPTQANLTIMPIRVLMEERDRNAELTLFNSSKTTNTYTLEWIHRRAREEGGYTKLEEPLDPLFDPNKTIKFSPRRVMVAPGQTQRIRLSLRRPADLPDGEYRAHLLLKKTSREKPKTASDQPGVIVQVNTNVGFSIPVVVRQGAYDAGVKISDPKFIQPSKPDEKPRLTFTLNRTGIHSLNGTVQAYLTPIGGEERLIGISKNVNIFHEIDKRFIGIGLKENNITAGTIRVTFEGESSQKGIIFDEQSFPVGQ